MFVIYLLCSRKLTRFIHNFVKINLSPISEKQQDLNKKFMSFASAVHKMFREKLKKIKEIQVKPENFFTCMSLIFDRCCQKFFSAWETGTKPCPHPVLRFLNIFYYPKILSLKSFNKSEATGMQSLMCQISNPVSLVANQICTETVNCQNIITRVLDVDGR